MSINHSNIHDVVSEAIVDLEKAIKRLSDYAPTVFLGGIALPPEKVSAITNLASWLSAVDRSYRSDLPDSKVITSTSTGANE